MVFGPGRSWGSSPQYPHFGVTLTTSFSWVSHIRKLISWGHRLFTQCVSWCFSESLPVQFASHLFLTYVLPSVSWGCEFCLGSAPAMRLFFYTAENKEVMSHQSQETQRTRLASTRTCHPSEPRGTAWPVPGVDCGKETANDLAANFLTEAACWTPTSPTWRDSAPIILSLPPTETSNWRCAWWNAP